jgi:hypothetical protein
MVKRRAGHSLAELIVAVVFLGLAVASMGSAAWLGCRWADAAVARQQAVRLAVSTLDSLVGASTVASGIRPVGPLTVYWAPSGEEVTVTVTGPASDTLVALRGTRLPALPVLSDLP